MKAPTNKKGKDMLEGWLKKAIEEGKEKTVNKLEKINDNPTKEEEIKEQG